MSRSIQSVCYSLKKEEELNYMATSPDKPERLSLLSQKYNGATSLLAVDSLTTC